MNNRIKYTLMVTLLVLSTLIVTPTTFAQEPNPDPQITTLETSIKLYLPFVAKNVNTDLTIGHVEITQAVQTDSNSVTLVANRQTVARIYTQTNSSESVGGVYVSISAYRGGSELPNSPLLVGPGTSPVTWSRADINTSFNTLLPSAWLSGNVSLNVTVDPSDAIEENNNTNNTVTKNLSFTSVPALNIKVVPIRYKHTPNGKTYSPASSSFIQAAFERLYPVSTVNVTVRSEYFYTGDLDNYDSWSELLDIVTALKENDGAPESQVYYGLIPLLDGNGNTWWGSSGGGYAGLGWVGYRESIGITDAYLKQYSYYVNGKDITNHEVGHNFGRHHAPCGDPSNPDPNFPYSGGIVGQYGFDMSAWQVIPTTYKDTMGYCDPNWVSDYTYLGLLANQLNFGAREIALKTTDSMYVRADIGDDGSAILKPVYALPGYPDETPTESEYSLEFIDANGGVIAAHPVAVRLAEGKDFQTRSIHATLPEPALPFSSLRLTKNGVTVGERTLAQSSQLRTTQPAIYLENGELILNWGMPQVPAIVRYTTDQGETWTTLGFDILEGELHLDALSLPQRSLQFEIILADNIGSSITLMWAP